MAWEGWQVLLLTVGIIAGLIACCVGLTILYERYLRHEMATREVQFVPADGEPPSEPFNGGLPAGTTNRKPGKTAAWAEKLKNKMGASAGSILRGSYIGPTQANIMAPHRILCHSVGLL